MGDTLSKPFALTGLQQYQNPIANKATAATPPTTPAMIAIVVVDNPDWLSLESELVESDEDDDNEV